MRKIILIFLLFCLITPVLADENILDEYVYPEALEIYGYIHYNNGSLVSYNSKVIASNENGIEVGKSYVDENTDNNIWKGRSREKISPTNDFRGILLAAKGLGTSLS